VVTELSDRLLSELAELVLGKVLQGGPDHLDIGRERRQGEMGQAREQLAAGKVTGSPEQHNDVGRDDVASSARTRSRRGIGDGLNIVLYCHASMLPPGAWPQQDDTRI
jgi:hypothetical protein